MPKVLEEALGRKALVMARKGKLKKRKKDSLSEAVDHFRYGTMTNMQKAGKIPPWRKLRSGPST